MISVPPGVRILVATAPVDFRRGMDSLAMLVQQAQGCSPYSGNLHVFRSKRGDRVKILAWDGTGLCLFAKKRGPSPEGRTRKGRANRTAERVRREIG